MIYLDWNTAWQQNGQSDVDLQLDYVKWIDFRGLYHDFVEQAMVKSCRPPRMKTKGRPQLKQFMKEIYFMKSEAI